MNDATGFSDRSKDLRQGDSLSPLLFIFVMKSFNRVLSRSVEGRYRVGSILGDVMGKIWILLIYFYLHHTILFCNSVLTQLKAIICVLLSYF